MKVNQVPKEMLERLNLTQEELEEAAQAAHDFHMLTCTGYCQDVDIMASILAPEMSDNARVLLAYFLGRQSEARQEGRRREPRFFDPDEFNENR